MMNTSTPAPEMETSSETPAHPVNAEGITFASMALAEPIQRALRDKNYVNPSPIQAQAIPYLLAGRDLVGLAQTGTGKTAAFALPLLHRLLASNKPRVGGCPRALILTPTRELASQIAVSFASYGKHLPLNHTVIYGGVGQYPQVRSVSRGTDIVVATPGRLLDLMEQGHVKLHHIEILVLDEVDRMLDMGFIHDIKRIVAKMPAQRQSMLFSATMPGTIQDMVQKILKDPVRVEVTPENSTAERIVQKVCHVSRADKPKLLSHLLQETKGLVLVFSRTKHGANRLAEDLVRSGVKAEAIHGNKTQAARERALQSFRTGRARVLVATDIAARGIDVKGITLVINYDLPDEPESYVHRIGRTARAGAEGEALSFCDPAERNNLRAIQRLIKQTIPVKADHPFALTVPVETERSGGRSNGRPESSGGNGNRRRFARPFRGQPSGGPRGGGDRNERSDRGGQGGQGGQGGGESRPRRFFTKRSNP